MKEEPMQGKFAISEEPKLETMPDGTEFISWEQPAEFTRTFHVNNGHPHADDANPGTADEPWKTIGRAAELLQPGQKVVVHAGIYRERVVPRRGGTGPDSMIAYEAAPGEEVVIKGSVVLSGPWTASEGTPGAWQTPLPACEPDAEDPFTLDNVLPPDFERMDWAHSLRGSVPYTLPRGLVFQDGRRLEQVALLNDLARSAGTYWVDRTARVLHLRPFDGVDPSAPTFEVTTLGTVFGPKEMGLGYIRIKGFRIEHAGNAFPWPQQGAVSTTRGHHWIIEDNRVAWANGVGIDVGKQAPWWPQPKTPVARHIVRRNVVTDCGVCAIAGLGPGGGRDFGLLIENNLLMRNAFHDVEKMFESAGIKTHNNVNCLIRNNAVLDTQHGSGIWMDWDNENSRCTGNTILQANTEFGGIFIEASNQPNLIDRNVVMNVEGNGLYEHDSCGQTFAHNLVTGCTGSGIMLKGKVTDRMIRNQPIQDGGHFVRYNVLEGNRTDVTANGPENVIE